MREGDSIKAHCVREAEGFERGRYNEQASTRQLRGGNAAAAAAAGGGEGFHVILNRSIIYRGC